MPNLKTDPKPEIMEFVEEALHEDPDVDVKALYERAQDVDREHVEAMSLRQFNARYVLQVKRRRANGGRRKRAEKKPPRAPKDSSRNGLQVLQRTALAPYPGLNPRERFDPGPLDELAASIREQGVLEPLLVTPRPPEVKDGDLGAAEGITHWIVAGERRWRASEAAELEELPCLVREIDEAQATAIALIENLQRSDLTPVEEARGIRRFMDANPDVTQAEVGEQLGGYGQAWVSNRLRLLQLPEPIQQLIQDEIITATAARNHLLPWCGVPDEDLRAEIFEAVFQDLADNDDNVLTEDDVWSAMAGPVIKRSKPVVAHRHTYTMVDGDQYDHVYVTLEDHEACDCGAPDAFWSSGRGWRNEMRCLDLDWWNGANSAGKAAWEEEQATAEEEEELPDPADFEWDDRSETVPKETARRAGLYQAPEVWFGNQARLYRSMDPTKLSADDLLCVESSWGDHEVLICVDRKAYNEAVEAGQNQLEALHREKLQEQAEEQLPEAEKLGRREVLVALLGKGTGIGYRHDEVVARAAAGLGIPIDIGPELERSLLKVDKKDLERLGQLLAYQLMTENAVSGHGDPLRDEARAELRERWTEELRVIAPGGRLPGEEE